MEGGDNSNDQGEKTKSIVVIMELLPLLLELLLALSFFDDDL